jgi:hypothetical protein
MKKQICYLLSYIDLDTREQSPLAIFNSKKELNAGIKRWGKDIDNDDLIEGEDYVVNDFYLNNFY